MIAGHHWRSQCRPALGGAGIGDDLRPENRQYLKCAKEHADETFSLTQLDPAEHTCLVYLSVLLCALAKKHNRKLRAPRESWLALIVGSRSWWQTKAASFLLAPRPLECLVTGNLATKNLFFKVVLILKIEEVPQIAGLSKGKREKNPVSTVAMDHVCVHVWRRHVRQCTCAYICQRNVYVKEKMCMHAAEGSWQLSRERQMCTLLSLSAKEWKKSRSVHVAWEGSLGSNWKAALGDGQLLRERACLAETLSLECTWHCSWWERKRFGIGSNTRWRSNSRGFPTSEEKPAFSKTGHRVVQRFLWWKTPRGKRNRVPRWWRVLRTGAASGAHDGGTTLPAMTFCTIPRLGGRREHRRKRLHGGSKIHKPERPGEPRAKLSGDKIPPRSGGSIAAPQQYIVADVGKENSQQIGDLVMSDGRVSAKWADKCVVWRERRSANAPDWHPVERPFVPQC